MNQNPKSMSPPRESPTHKHPCAECSETFDHYGMDQNCTDYTLRCIRCRAAEARAKDDDNLAISDEDLATSRRLDAKVAARDDKAGDQR